jgi:hypothetical protein
MPESIWEEWSGMGTTLTFVRQRHYTITSLPHYGGRRGGFAEVWYVGNLNGSICIPATGLGHGFSGWALFTTRGGAVPDGGRTAQNRLLA